MWVAVTPQPFLLLDLVSHPGYLISIIMLTKSNAAQAAQTADAAVKASMEGFYFRPIRVAKVKDLLLRLLLNSVPYLPSKKVTHYTEAFDYVIILTSYVFSIEQTQHGWAASGRLTYKAHQARVRVAAEEQLQQIARFSSAREILNIERAVNALLQAGNIYGEEDQIKSFWEEHAETMEVLATWLVSLQAYLKELVIKEIIE